MQREECVWAGEYLPVLEKTKLFAGVDKEEIAVLLSCLQARRKPYAKGEYVLRQGERIGQILLLAKGSLLLQQDDYWGNRSIVNRIGEGEIFAEAYAVSGGALLPHDVIAVEESTVLFLDAPYGKSFSPICPRRREGQGVRLFPFPLTGRNWRIIWRWTAAPCPGNCAGCGTRG